MQDLNSDAYPSSLRKELHVWIGSGNDSVIFTDKCIEAVLPPSDIRHVRAQSLDLTDTFTCTKHRTTRSVYRPMQWRHSLPFHSPPSRGTIVKPSAVRKTPECSHVNENRVLPPIITMTQSRARLPFSVVQHQAYSKIKREASPEDFTRAPLNPKLLKDVELKQQFDKMWSREVRLLNKKKS
mmetsp:Transcript_24744/g.43587  ORF Transcript_24744/g.43587 Transcript_24744/m.43587 type:complete len:182 (+) Transcript_24744:1371-1916(+)